MVKATAGRPASGKALGANDIALSADLLRETVLEVGGAALVQHLELCGLLELAHVVPCPAQLAPLTLTFSSSCLVAMVDSPFTYFSQITSRRSAEKGISSRPA